MATKEIVQKRARLRFRIIEALYDAGGGSLRAQVLPEWFAERLGERREEIVEALYILRAEGLVHWQTNGMHTSLTRAGIAEYEESLNTDAGEGTEHFPGYVIHQTQHFHGPVGSVQTGANATANVQQNIGTKAEDLLTLLAQLRTEVAALPVERRVPAEQAVRLIEKQAKAEEPDKDVLELAQEKLEKAVDGLDGFTRVLDLVGKISPALMALAAAAAG